MLADVFLVCSGSEWRAILRTFALQCVVYFPACDNDDDNANCNGSERIPVPTGLSPAVRVPTVMRTGPWG